MYYYTTLVVGCPSSFILMMRRRSASRLCLTCSALSTWVIPHNDISPGFEVNNRAKLLVFIIILLHAAYLVGVCIVRLYDQSVYQLLSDSNNIDTAVITIIDARGWNAIYKKKNISTDRYTNVRY